jgi:hypothetical protein
VVVAAAATEVEERSGFRLPRTSRAYSVRAISKQERGCAMAYFSMIGVLVVATSPVALACLVRTGCYTSRTQSGGRALG